MPLYAFLPSFAVGVFSLTKKYLFRFKFSTTPPPTRPDITHLRQKTKQALNPNPRTSGGASWTSLADHLPSHRSATGAAGYSDNTYFVKPVPGAISLVRPKTELAQMGLERWTSKMAEVRVEERQNKSRIVEMITRPLSIVSPFAVAMAGEYSAVWFDVIVNRSIPH